MMLWNLVVTINECNYLRNNMREKELGTMILSSNHPNSPSKMPEIPIRPNTSIPITIGLLMILGSLLVLFDGGGAIFNHYTELTIEGAEDQVELLKVIGVDIKLEEYMQWDSEFKESNFHLVTGVIKSCAGLLIFTGGLQLCLQKHLGVKVSIGGGVLWLISQAISISWASKIESEINISLATQWDVAATAMCFICNAFCILLPLIPMLVPSGKAALTPSQTNIKTKINALFEEE